MSEERLDELREILYNPNLKGYLPNVCNELLQELEKQCKKQKEVIDKVVECLNLWQIPECDKGTMREILFNTNKQNVLDILKEVSE